MHANFPQVQGKENSLIVHIMATHFLHKYNSHGHFVKTWHISFVILRSCTLKILKQKYSPTKCVCTMRILNLLPASDNICHLLVILANCSMIICD